MQDPVIPPLAERIFTLDELHWGFDDQGPRLLTKPRHPEASAWPIYHVDPFPCYAHDTGMVRHVAATVENAFPLGFMPNWYVLSFETTSRTNGYASKQEIYRSPGSGDIFEPYIVLAGKRIPLHPAMTRYLVAHEYGHCVDYWIQYRRGLKSHGVNTFDREYAAMRGIEPNGEYGARRWHTNIGEVIANDFRIAVCGIESEFWPHPGIAHPNHVPALGDYWTQLIEQYAQQ